MAKELSERQLKILTFLREYISENRFPLTIREIGEHVGISSTHIVHYNLAILEREDFIDQTCCWLRCLRWQLY